MPSDKFELKLAYDSEDRVEYVMKAVPGTRSDAAEWQILKLAYEGVTSKIETLSYANNSSLFEFIADDYASYKYTPIKTTIIVPTKTLPAGFIFDLTTSTINYTLSGDTADLLVSEALFNNAAFITVKEGTREFAKGQLAVWQSATSIKINENSIKDSSMIIVS